MSQQAQTATADIRRALVSAETNTGLRQSPDGRTVAYVKSGENGQELWIHTVAGTRRLAAHPGQMLADLQWTADGSMLCYRHTARGREAWSLSVVRMEDATQVHLPHPGSVAEYWLATDDPHALVYSGRTAGSRYGALMRVDLENPTREGVILAENPGFHRWLVDGRLSPRGGIRLLGDSSAEVVVGECLATARVVHRVGVDHLPDLSIERFSPDGARLYLLSSADAGARRLVVVEPDATVRTVFAHAELDVQSYPVAGNGVWFDPTTGEPDACTVMGQRLHHHPLTPTMRQRLARLTGDDLCASVIVDRSADDHTWLVADVRGDGPVSYRRFTPETGRSEPVLVNRPELVGCRLSRLEDFCFPANDGRRLTGYAMRPLHGSAPFPTVMLVHGGPAGQDTWRFHAEAQYLASLGYLSLHVNYRGSRGFGVEFRLAGNGEWGGRMQQDLYDAVGYGVSTGLVDPDRVAFFGASYGGYAALLAACTRPAMVRCAVAVSPPCDLLSFADTVPAYWQPLAPLIRRQVLQRRDGRLVDRLTLERRSPTHTNGDLCSPLLIAHGVRDPRVPVADVDTFVATATERGTPVRYLRFDDEGHHVKSNVNRGLLFGEIQQFLEGHLARG